MLVLREGPAKLTKASVEAAWRRRGTGQRLVIGDSECRGLALVTNPTGQTWRFDFKPRGLDPATGRRFPSQSVTIGTPESHSVDDARTAAGALKARTKAGSDPNAERKAARAAVLAARQQAEADARAAREAELARAKEQAFTVRALIDLYADKHVAKLRPATRRDVLSRLRQHLAPIADTPAQQVGRRDVATVVDAAGLAGETTARRVRDYARAMWRWAAGRGSLPTGQDNPWASAPAPGRDKPRERALDADEVGLVWRAAGTLPSPYGPLVRFALLTLARREEVTDMTWGEVAADMSAWTQPGSRTKNGKPHLVHLSAPARDLLRQMSVDTQPGKLPPAEQRVFGIAGNRPVTTHSWVKRKLDTAIAAELAEADSEAVPAWVLHDFRRSGVTWLAGAGFAPHVADRLLNHVQGTIKGVAAIYQKGEFAAERKAALDAWGAHVLAAGEGGVVASNVARLEPARAAKAG